MIRDVTVSEVGVPERTRMNLYGPYKDRVPKT